MSDLGEKYKLAYDSVLRKYANSPEDKWKVTAVQNKSNSNVLDEFVQEVDNTVTELLNPKMN